FSLTLRQAQGPKNLLYPSTISGSGKFIAARGLPLADSEPVELASLFPHPSTSSGSEKFTLPFDNLRGRKIYSTLRQAQGPENLLRPEGFHSRTVSLSNWLAYLPHPSTGSGAEKFTLPFDRLRDRKLYCGH
ncbi:MAG: hypothetical protein ACKO16_02985, partial [Gemmataceae bacterium]